jgi:hypothetical protein
MKDENKIYNNIMEEQLIIHEYISKVGILNLVSDNKMIRMQNKMGNSENNFGDIYSMLDKEDFIICVVAN